MEVEKMGAVTSKEGYDLEGKKFCKEIFHFSQNDGLCTLTLTLTPTNPFPCQHPPPSPPPPPKNIYIIFTLSPFEKLTSDSQRLLLKILAVIMCSHYLRQYIFQRIGSTARKGSDWGGSKGYSL